MSDTVETPVSGNAASKGAPDGVSGVPGDNDAANIHGRSAAGESGGGAYPNPHTGKKPTSATHGGQTDIAYYGGGQGGDDGGGAANGVAGSASGTRSTIAADPDADRESRTIAAEGRTFEVVETSGVAEAEILGKIGTDAPYEAEQRRPGAG